MFSTNFRRFKFDPGVAEAYEVTNITKQTIPPDFARNPRIHTCFRVTPAASPRSGLKVETSPGAWATPAGGRDLKRAGGHGAG